MVADLGMALAATEAARQKAGTRLLTAIFAIETGNSNTYRIVYLYYKKVAAAQCDCNSNVAVLAARATMYHLGLHRA